MKKIPFARLLAVLAAVVSLPAPAKAQLYASPAGTGANCFASAPCSLTTAINGAAANNAEIVACISGGDALLSPATVTASFVVDCPGAVVGVDGPGPAFTLAGTTAQIVKLRNLTFSGYTSPSAQPFIRVTGGATLIIENCRFEDQGQFGAGGTPIAVQFQPTSPAAQLIIRDTVFANNGIEPGTGGGLQVAPGAGGSASVKLERVSFEFNVTGMVLSGPVSATMINSSVSSNRSNGILVGSGSTLLIKDSTLEYNVGSAVSVTGGGTVRLSNNDVESNQVGVSNSGGQALSFKNNRILGNGSTATLGTITGGQ